MNSLGSSAKWTSYGSLPSSLSFVLSETEDEADVFSEGEGDCGRTKSLTADKGITFSGRLLFQYFFFTAKQQSRHSCNARLSFSPFSQCADLHRFTRPLLELLHGLKTGRFDKGLTSFQQSVAIDRLQRILGVLQKPDMGERYLQNLLQIEMMLKIWFPQLAFQSIVAPKQTVAPRLPPRWRQNQLHMPVKKRKLSWSDSDVPTKHRHHHQLQKHWSCQASTALETVSTCLPGSPTKMKTPEEGTVEAAACSCRAGHEFTDSAGTVCRLAYLCSNGQNETRTPSEVSLSSHSGSPVTQDNSVSSSDTITTNDSPSMKADAGLDYISIKLGAKSVCNGCRPLKTDEGEEEVKC
uniref:Circadian associated repressor of transcription a n=1 Tax=Scophthalmus maximus TaxID=52904 RepID=A0A8D2ZLF7_SCOMX